MDGRQRSWATSDRWVPSTFIRPLIRFTRIEAASGIVLLAAAVAALVIANTELAGPYFELLDETIDITLPGFHLEESIHDFINDGLMAVFFFVVGLEIKRELVLGDLRDPKAAALPVMAAIGGMLVPAGVYVLINLGGDPEALRGWGIPMATDIAFALGVVALLGSRVSPGAKLFLLAVAIADDIGAIAVIALFYTDDLEPGYLAAALGALGVVWIARAINIRAMWFYVPAALVVWYLTLESGVHATLAGVALGFLTPAHPNYSPREFDERARTILDQYPVEASDHRAQEHADYEVLLLADVAADAVSPLTRMENRLTPWSSYVIVPLFALANAGVDFRGTSLTEALTSSVALGVILGLVVGKIFGISILTFIAVRLGMGRLPAGMGWSQVVGLAAVAGIGFTVSLFITGLAFDDPVLTDLAKVGIFAGSLLAGIIGLTVLGRAKPPPPR